MKTVLVLLLSLLAGCASGGIISLPSVTTVSSIPWNATTMTIVNNTPFSITATVGGELQGTCGVGGQLIVKANNWSGRTSQCSVVVIAEDASTHDFRGSTYRTFWIDGYTQRNEVWIVRISDFS